MNLLHIIYPTVHTISRHLFQRNVLCELASQKQLRNSDWKSLQEYSRKHAVKYANRMAEVSPAYRRLLTERGIRLPIDETPESWRTLPILRKADFQADPESWVNAALDRSKLSWSSTSGSSGEPFSFPETAESRMAEFVSFELSMREIGWKPGQQEGLIKLTATHVGGVRGMIKRIMGTLPVTFSAVDYRAGDTETIVKAFNAAGVKLLRSYPTCLLLISEEMLRRGLRCHIPHIIVYGEGLSPSRAHVIEEAFNAAIYRDYGGSEAMHIGFQCTRCPSYKLDLTRFYVELLDGDRPVSYNEPGEVVVTCFRNNAFPFIRYRMGDIGVMLDPQTSCPCEGKVWRLGEIRGRILDVIYAPNGEQLDAAFIYLVMEHALNHILAFKFIQRAPDLIELLYVPRHPKARENLDSVEKKIENRVHGAMRVILTEVPEIPAEPSGKRKILVPLKPEWKTSVE
jgi:phenylacetate-CoA ligase